MFWRSEYQTVPNTGLISLSVIPVMASFEDEIDGLQWEEWENCMDILDNGDNEVSLTLIIFYLSL